MESGRPSRTAEGAALLRAAHQRCESPQVLDDPVVPQLVDPAALASLLADRGALDAPVTSRLRGSIVARSRWAEDRLHEAVGRGVQQYVVLGAGLDSFAYRSPYAPATLRVFEVDHPATQAWKRERLRAAGIALPPSLEFVAADFERQTLDDAMAPSGLDRTRPVFVSWLGVTVYLTRPAIFETLRWVASLAPGSAIAFDYAADPSRLGAATRAAFARLGDAVSGLGERFVSVFDPAAFARDVAALGLVVVEDLDTNALVARYFQDRTDGLRPGSTSHMLLARVPDAT